MSGFPGADPLWSPDGRKLAYVAGANRDIWVADANGSNPRQLVSTARDEVPVAWLAAPATR